MCECPTMYHEEIVTARKPHRCCECGTTVAKGEKYESVSGMWDGQFDRIKTCIPCMEIRKKVCEGISAGNCCELPTFGDLRQYMLDAGEFDELYAEAHARWLAARSSQQHCEQSS
jgi:hypothetical protein